MTEELPDRLPYWVAAETGEPLEKCLSIPMDTLALMFPVIAERGPFNKELNKLGGVRYEAERGNLLRRRENTEHAAIRVKLDTIINHVVELVTATHPADDEVLDKLWDTDRERYWQLAALDTVLMVDFITTAAFNGETPPVRTLNKIAAHVACPDLYGTDGPELQRVTNARVQELEDEFLDLRRAGESIRRRRMFRAGGWVD